MNYMKARPIKAIALAVILTVSGALMDGCAPKGPGEVVTGNAASKVYVAPGSYDEFYNVVSGGFNGQMAIYGIPSGRLFKILPVFSVFPENGYGYSEETKPMLNTSHGFIPWDDLRSEEHTSELQSRENLVCR